MYFTSGLPAIRSLWVCRQGVLDLGFLFSFPVFDVESSANSRRFRFLV
jgi:hypothetical protein